jgi:hypothetical protein
MEHTETTITSRVDAHGHATMRWGAIIGGSVVAAGIAALMYIAGIALGFTAFDPYNADAVAKGVGAGTAVWMVLTWTVSLFLGGMFASWFDGRSDQTVGTLHGITVWGLCVAASGLLLATGLMHAFRASDALLRDGAAMGSVTAGTPVAPRAARGPLGGPTEDAIIGLQAQINQSVAQPGAHNPSAPSAGVAPAGAPASMPGGIAATASSSQPGAQVNPINPRRDTDQLDRRSMAAVAGALLKGRTETAKAILAANTSMSQTQIDQTLQSLSTQVEKYKADIQAAATAEARYAAMAAWIAFFGTLLALVAAAIGGWMGAGHIHRVHHLRRYETTVSRPL